MRTRWIVTYTTTALMTAATLLTAGCASDEHGEDEPSHPGGARSFVKADNDLATSQCTRSNEGFTLTATIDNQGGYDAAYIFTATITSPEAKKTLASESSARIPVAAGETAEVNLPAFGAKSPSGAECTVTARKQKTEA